MRRPTPARPGRAAIVERALPERGDIGLPNPVGVDSQAAEERAERVRRTDERRRGHVPLDERTFRERRQPLEPVHALFRIPNRRPERKAQRGRIEMRQHVVEICQAPAVAFEQRLDEPFRTIELFADGGLP